MPDFSAILEHYKFWDDFVSRWLRTEMSCCAFLPEPWWGWTPEDGDLNSVTLNLNPGPGGKLQTKACIRCAMGGGSCPTPYSVALFDGTLRSHLEATEKWHYYRRYKPLMEAIEVADMAKDTRHHLSVEIAPFHDSSKNSIYLKEHREDIISHSLEFAAKASGQIVNYEESQKSYSLKNKVIVRSSLKNIINIAGKSIIEESKQYRKTLEGLNNSFKNDRISIFKLKKEKFDDVLFICLSGARNNLPSQNTLREILKQINNNN